MVRLGNGKRSPMRKSSNQRCSATSLCLRGSKSEVELSPVSMGPALPSRGTLFDKCSQALLCLVGADDVAKHLGRISDTATIVEIVGAHERGTAGSHRVRRFGREHAR